NESRHTRRGIQPRAAVAPAPGPEVETARLGRSRGLEPDGPRPPEAPACDQLMPLTVKTGVPPCRRDSSAASRIPNTRKPSQPSQPSLRGVVPLRTQSTKC